MRAEAAGDPGPWRQQAILGRTHWGPTVFGCQAPDSGNAEILARFGTAEHKERYLKPLLENEIVSCFSMTEPGAGADPTLLTTNAVLDGDEWVINGHKWFISGARGAKFALLVARTEEDPELPQAANSCFIVDLPSEGWNIVRDVHTMSGGHNHCEILIEDLDGPHARFESLRVWERYRALFLMRAKYTQLN